MIGSVPLVAARRARLVVVATAVVTGVALGLGGTVVAHLAGGSEQFADPGSESIRAFELVQRVSGEDPDPGLVALVRRGDPAAVAAALRRDPEVARTQVLGPFVLGFFRHGLDPRSDEATSRLRERFAGSRDVVLGGGAVAAQEINRTVREDLTRAELIAFPVVLLLSLAVFRGFVAALVPPAVGAAAIGLTLLGLRAAVEVTDVSVFALNLVTGLGFGLSIDYSLLLVSRYREELARHGHSPEAIRATVRTAGRTIAFSALTVAAAMGSLALFPLPFLRSMALGGALVAVAALVVALGPLPAALHWLGPRIDALAPARWQRPPSSGGWARLAAVVMRRPGLVATAAAALLVALALPVLGVRFTGVDATALPRSASARQVADALAEGGLRGVASPINVVLAARPGPERLARTRALAGVVGVRGPVAVGAGLWRVDVFSRDEALSSSTLALVNEVRQLFPGGLVAGRAAAFLDQRASLLDHLPWALLTLALTTFALLFAFTGSVVLPLKALVLNVLTIGGAIGLLVLVFQHGAGVEGLEQTQPVLLGATAFGLSTDYAVFLLSRIKEARDAGAGEMRAVAAGLERTGRIVTAAALLFCVAVGAFATSKLVFVQQLGLGTAAAVALDATVVRALLVPSLMAILGRWNWWAPKPLRRLQLRVRPRP